MLRRFCGMGLEAWGSDSRGVETTRQVLRCAASGWGGEGVGGMDGGGWVCGGVGWGGIQATGQQSFGRAATCLPVCLGSRFNNARNPAPCNMDTWAPALLQVPPPPLHTHTPPPPGCWRWFSPNLITLRSNGVIPSSLVHALLQALPAGAAHLHAPLHPRGAA